jgi:hypothetical protein
MQMFARTNTSLQGASKALNSRISLPGQLLSAQQRLKYSIGISIITIRSTAHIYCARGNDTYQDVAWNGIVATCASRPIYWTAGAGRPEQLHCSEPSMKRQSSSNYVGYYEIGLQNSTFWENPARINVRSNDRSASRKHLRPCGYMMWILLPN